MEKVDVHRLTVHCLIPIRAGKAVVLRPEGRTCHLV